MLPGREFFKFEVADAHALDFLDRMAGLEEQAAQCVAARFGERDFVPGIVLALEARDARAGLSCELLDFREGQQIFEFHLVGLRQAVGLDDEVGQVAVIGEKNES